MASWSFRACQNKLTMLNLRQSMDRKPNEFLLFDGLLTSLSLASDFLTRSLYGNFRKDPTFLDKFRTERPFFLHLARPWAIPAEKTGARSIDFLHKRGPCIFDLL